MERKWRGCRRVAGSVYQRGGFLLLSEAENKGGFLCYTNPGDAILCYLQSSAKATLNLPQKGVAHHHQHSQTSLSPPTWVRPWPWAWDSHSVALRTPAHPSATQGSCVRFQKESRGHRDWQAGWLSPLSSFPHIPKHLCRDSGFGKGQGHVVREGQCSSVHQHCLALSKEGKVLPLGSLFVRPLFFLPVPQHRLSTVLSRGF